MKRTGKIYGINKNLITVEFEDNVLQNEIGYARIGESDIRLKAEIIRIKGNRADLQVFEETRGLRQGDLVEFTGSLLSAELGPGLLGQFFDGMQNPLEKLADKYGEFLERGEYLPPLDEDRLWQFTPIVKKGATVQAGDTLGTVPEGIITHKIMVPFYLKGRYEITTVSPPMAYHIKDTIAVLKDQKGDSRPITMRFQWPVKKAVEIYEERLEPREPLITQIRIIDTLFPVAKGGTYCTPGPFGAGKTVLQQITSRNAQADIVIIAACGERAGEIVETINEFPKLIDPRTGRSLLERTIIVGNTSSMPVAARESSIYTAVTMAEYYRQMGYDVILLADSTSRWAQAMRERSGRLEEIPGEEAFPAYLESIVANFYERAGRVRMKDGSIGSITIGGTVSPAGGNFDEPVTQATLKAVGAFHALSRERSDARRYPAIDPLESWSKYTGVIEKDAGTKMIRLLNRAYEVSQMMKVVGEEGTPMDDFVLYLKGEFFDSVYLQQNAFDPIDGATSRERQLNCFGMMENIINTRVTFKNKDEARSVFSRLRSLFIEYNASRWESDEMKTYASQITNYLNEYCQENRADGFMLHDKPFMENHLDSTFVRAKNFKNLNDGIPVHREEDAESIQ